MANIQKSLSGGPFAVDTSTANAKGDGAGVLYTDRRDFYVDPNSFNELYKSTTPFLTFGTKAKTVTNMKDPVFKLFEHRSGWVDQRFTATSGTITIDNQEDTITVPASSTSNFIGFGPTSKGSFLVGMVFAVHAADASTGRPSGDRKAVVVCTGYTSDTSIKVKGITLATGSTLALTSGDWFVKIGNAQGSGGESPEPSYDELSVVYGSCQIFRTPLQLEKNIINAALRGEKSELLRLRKLKGQEHEMDKERTYLFGSSVQGTGMDGTAFSDPFRTDANGEPIRTTMGIYEVLLRYGNSDPTSIDQNIFNIPEASFSYADFVDMTEKIFQYYPEDGIKYLFCGMAMSSYWSKMEGPGGFGMGAKSKWTVKMSPTQMDEKLGFNFKEIETPSGIIRLVPTHSITKYMPYSKTGVIVDWNNVTRFVYEGQRFSQNIKTDNAPNYQKDEYYAHEGMGYSLLPTHKLLKLV